MHRKSSTASDTTNHNSSSIRYSYTQIPNPNLTNRMTSSSSMELSHGNDTATATATPYFPYQESNSFQSLEESLKEIDKEHYQSTYSPRSNLNHHQQMNDDNDNRSTLTNEGIDDLQGYIIINLVVLVGDMARGVTYPTLWPRVMHFGGSEVTQGFTVAAFSFGRIISSPIFGERSTTHGYRSALMLSLSIFTLGTVFYAFANSIQSLILAQTMLGIGSGTLGVTRAFVADVTPTRDRTRYMAYLTAVQYGGFTVTPFVGATFSAFFGDPNDDENVGIINQYTAPAFLMTFMGTLVLGCLAFLFDDRIVVKNAKMKIKNPDANDLARSLTCCGITVYDAAILGCMLLNVSTKGSISCFETLGVAFAVEHFSMDSSSTGLVVSISGACGVFVLLQMKALSKHFTDIQMITGGMFIILLASASLIGIRDEEQVDSWRFVIVIFLIYAIGYPIGHTAVIGLFSKIVGRRPQGTLLGWFASAGSLARVMFPIMSGYLSRYEGDSALFVALVIILSISITFVWSYQGILTAFST